MSTQKKGGSSPKNGKNDTFFTDANSFDILNEKNEVLSLNIDTLTQENITIKETMNEINNQVSQIYDRVNMLDATFSSAFDKLNKDNMANIAMNKKLHEVINHVISMASAMDAKQETFITTFTIMERNQERFIVNMNERMSKMQTIIESNSEITNIISNDKRIDELQTIVKNQNTILMEEINALKYKIETERIDIGNIIQNAPTATLEKKLEEILDIGIPTTIRKFEIANATILNEITTIRNTSTNIRIELNQIKQNSIYNTATNPTTQGNGNGNLPNNHNNQFQNHGSSVDEVDGRLPEGDSTLPPTKEQNFKHNNYNMNNNGTSNNQKHITPKNSPTSSNDHLQPEPNHNTTESKYNLNSNCLLTTGVQALLDLLPSRNSPITESDKFAELMRSNQENQSYRSMRESQFEPYNGGGPELISTIKQWNLSIANHSRKINLQRYMDDAVTLITARFTHDAKDWWTEIGMEYIGCSYPEFIELLYDRFHIAIIDKSRRNHFSLIKWSFKEFPSHSTAASLHKWYTERNHMYGSVENGEKFIPESKMCWFVWEELHHDVQTALRPMRWDDQDEDDCPFSRVDDLRKKLTTTFQKPNYKNKDKFAQEWIRCKGEAKSAHAHLFKTDDEKTDRNSDQNSNSTNNKKFNTDISKGDKKDEDKKTDTNPKPKTDDKNSKKPDTEKNSPTSLSPIEDQEKNEKALRYIISTLKAGTLHTTTWYLCPLRTHADHTNNNPHSYALCESNPRYEANIKELEKIFGKDWKIGLTEPMKRDEKRPTVWVAVTTIKPDDQNKPQKTDFQVAP